MAWAGGGGQGSRVRELIARYGRVGLATHVVLSAGFYAGCYALVSSNADVPALLRKVGIQKAEEEFKHEVQEVLHSDEHDFSITSAPEAGSNMKTNSGDTHDGVASKGSKLLVAWVLYKAIMPIRIPTTIAVTPIVARVLQRMR
eukprot:jgi/Chlat1/7940/Chrsp68S07368